MVGHLASAVDLNHRYVAGRQDELGQLPLHPGFAASWPSVAALLDA